MKRFAWLRLLLSGKSTGIANVVSLLVAGFAYSSPGWDTANYVYVGSSTVYLQSLPDFNVPQLAGDCRKAVKTAATATNSVREAVWPVLLALAVPASPEWNFLLIFVALAGFVLFLRLRKNRLERALERTKAESALRESEARNRAILRALPDLMFLQDRDGTYLDYYARNSSDLYTPAEHFLGKNMREILPPDVTNIAVRKFEEAAATGGPATFEYSLTINDTKYFYEGRVVLCDGNRFLTITRDITAAKHAEVELRTAKRFIEKIMDTLPNLLFVYDCSEERHTYMNRGITTVLGYSESDIRKMGPDVLAKLVHPEDGPRVRAQLAELKNADDGAVLTTVYRMRNSQGEWRWILGNETVLDRDEDRTVKSVIGTATDITEHRRIQEQLQVLSARLLNFQDEELRNLAADLHEVIAQNLFAVTLNLKRLRQFEADSKVTEPSRLDTLLAECETLCESSIREIRSSSYSLHPPALQEVGVVPTLRWYIDGFEKRSGIQVHLQVAGPMRRFPLEMETYIFRVMQQGLSNVARHSGSSNAIVRVKENSSDVVFEIEDFGRSFGDSTLGDQSPQSEDRTDLRLNEMRQRLRQFGGRLQIHSTRRGTLLIATVPISAAIAVEREEKTATREAL